MLTISGFRINLAESNDYVRCAILIHLLAALVVIKSSLPWAFIIPILLILLFIVLNIFVNKIPLSHKHDLYYHSGCWHLQKVEDEPVLYQQVIISFEGGIFILLRLTGLQNTRLLVVFKDQITQDQHRFLKIYERKHPKSLKKNKKM